ncbi:unnamed protein product [Clonostachys chloroleuca]|uniref:BTB domain-containing protein n=1 Tax=Clonostachys chloroleuca TaxID=1926264 RepID=A0AA35LQ95_9HYPO|nr:unnamed protein product [Clonostachys chloroleuca]
MAGIKTIQQEYFELLQSGKYSDFVLACNGAEFNLHKAIVCIHSPVIAAELDGPSKEATLSRYSCNQYDTATMARLIQFLYVGDYSSSPVLAGTWPSLEILWEESRQSQLQDASQPSPRCLQAEISLNIAADYFGIPALLAMTRARAQEIIKHHWNAAEFPALLKNAEENVGDEYFWKILVDAAANHVDSLAKSSEFHEVDWQIGTYKQIFCAQAQLLEERKAWQKRMSSQSSYVPQAQAQLH